RGTRGPPARSRGTRRRRRSYALQEIDRDDHRRKEGDGDRERDEVHVGGSFRSERIGRAPREAGERAGMRGGIERARAVDDELPRAGDAGGVRVLDVAQKLYEVRDERPRGDDLRALERRAGGQGAGGRPVELVEDRLEASGDVLGLATGRELARAERERRRVVGAGAVRERAVEGVAPQQDPEAQQRRRAGAA